MIELCEVSIKAGGFSLSDVSFEVKAGEYAVLMGKTGCGKTTILEAICGLRRVTSGRILLDGKDVTSLPPAQRRAGFVPQDLALFATMSVRKHLEFGPRRHGFEAERIASKVEELSGLLGIGGLLERKPGGLSGGEAQRVALGRALAFEPNVLLMDEPFSALDEWTREEMYRLLKNVKRSTGVTVLHITHSKAEADALGDRRFLLVDGRLEEAGAEAANTDLS
ncbi:MAG: ABC-type sugar transport system ATPase subunit [Verrucomicrobiales bacterium]|jgi:ABC-type sugar transport system ATPase subunit